MQQRDDGLREVARDAKLQVMPADVRRRVQMLLHSRRDVAPVRARRGTTAPWPQRRQIAEQKMVDLNAANLDTATSMMAGTARSMGIEVID